MTEMDERRPPSKTANILLIGPGAAGKSSLGAELALLLCRRFVDLDDEFLCRVGHIGSFIREEGYERYKSRNSDLAAEILVENIEPILLVASSGFLTPDNPQSTLEANLRLLRSCYSICLLPSRDLERSVSVIVERQLARPFSRSRSREEAVIRDRYPVYLRLGDLVVFSTEPSNDIAHTVARHLSGKV